MTRRVAPPPSTPAEPPRWRVAIVAGLLAVVIAGAAWMLLGRRHWPQAPRGAPIYWGVNLAGAEFAPDDESDYGKSYIYPDAKIAAPFLDAGMNMIRLSIRWERIQPWPQAMLSPNESKRLDDALDALSDAPLVILDVHNYGNFQGQPLGGDAHSADLFADLWTRLAARYKDRSKVAFGLMNEPQGIDARVWRALADRAVTAIRATGATNLILVPGTNWTGASSWTQGGEASNAAAFAGFTDPGGNFAFEMHQYLDDDGSGHTNQCVGPDAATGRIDGATAWLRTHHYRAILAEFAAGPQPACLASLDALLDRVTADGDVWIGWSWWAAGPWWGDAWNSIQPGKDGQDKPQMTVLRRYIGGHRPGGG